MICFSYSSFINLKITQFHVYLNIPLEWRINFEIPCTIESARQKANLFDGRLLRARFFAIQKESLIKRTHQECD